MWLFENLTSHKIFSSIFWLMLYYFKSILGNLFWTVVHVWIGQLRRNQFSKWLVNVPWYKLVRTNGWITTWNTWHGWWKTNPPGWSWDDNLVCKVVQHVHGRHACPCPACCLCENCLTLCWLTRGSLSRELCEQEKLLRRTWGNGDGEYELKVVVLELNWHVCSAKARNKHSFKKCGSV